MDKPLLPENERALLSKAYALAKSRQPDPTRPDSTRLGRELAAIVETWAADGNTLADCIINRWTQEGAHRAAYLMRRQEKSSQFRKVDAAGEIVRVQTMSAAVAVRKRNIDGTPTIGRQLPFWWDTTWEEFLDLLRTKETELATRATNLELLRQVELLHQKYPEAKTPGAACLLDGKTPEDFQFSEQSA